MINEATYCASVIDTLASYTGFLARAKVSQSYEFVSEAKRGQTLAPKVVLEGLWSREP